MNFVVADLQVVEFTDPGCPWSWGSEPTLRRLALALGPTVGWRRVFGILFDEDEDPAPDEAAETSAFTRYIQSTTAHTHAPTNPRLSHVCRTSWPASCAAKAAEAQGPSIAGRVVRRLRESSFVTGEPADTVDTVVRAVRGVAGLDEKLLLSQLESTRVAVEADWVETRNPCPEVRAITASGPHSGGAKESGEHLRYALPTLLFVGPDASSVVPGWRPYEEYVAAARAAAPGLAIGSGHLIVDEVFAHFETVTTPELIALTGNPTPPTSAVELPLSGGSLWLSPREAAIHPAVHLRDS